MSTTESFGGGVIVTCRPKSWNSIVITGPGVPLAPCVYATLRTSPLWSTQTSNGSVFRPLALSALSSDFRTLPLEAEAA